MTAKDIKVRGEITFASTSTERYDTDMLEKAKKTIENAGIEITGEFGGTFLPTMMSDNGFVVNIEPEKVPELIAAVGEAIGKPGEVEFTEDSD